MNTGIVIYSKTGHTLEVAQKLQKNLRVKGRSAKLMQVTVKDPEKATRRKAELKGIPDPAAYGLLYFGAPVWGLSACSVMVSYLKQAPSLVGKKAACFVTMSLPFSFLGGSRALRKMQKLLKEKGAETIETAVIGWGRRHREESIQEAVERLGALCLSAESSGSEASAPDHLLPVGSV